MITAAGSASSQVERVLKHFDARSTDWEEIYEDTTVRGTVIRMRHALALEWIRELPLSPEARALEIGCGAGFLSISLTELGYAVDALDASERMVELARAHAQASAAQRMRVGLGDAHSLGYGDEAFDLVVALGVLPWLHSPRIALREMARVTAPAGVVVVSADNRFALHRVLDPRFTPAFEPMNRRIKRYLERKGLWSHALDALDARSHAPADIDRIAFEAGLTKIRSRTLGFGPFSVAGRAIPDSLGLRVHRRLESMAERGVPVIRSGGHQYVLLAQKAAV